MAATRCSPAIGAIAGIVSRSACAGHVPQGLRGPLFGLLGAAYPKLDWAPRPLRAKATLQELARDAGRGLFRLGLGLRPRRCAGGCSAPALPRELQGYDARRGAAARICGDADSDDPLSQVQYADFKTYLPGDILTKVDRASMASSLEVRVPLLDHTLVEWAARLPSRFETARRPGQANFQSGARTLCPNEILYRPKQGFVVPLARWFRGPLRAASARAADRADAAAVGLFDTGGGGHAVGRASVRQARP